MQGPAAEAATPAAARLRDAGAAFLRIFSPAHVALVFWVCFGLAASELLALATADTASQLLYHAAFMVRQSLVTGLSVLLVIALAEAVLPIGLAPAWRWSALGVSIAAAAALSTGVRLLLASGSFFGAGPLEWPWLAAVVTLWTGLGLAAVALFDGAKRQADALCRLRDDETARAMLANQALEAHLAALQAQIEPHFLFNTLANVRRLYEVDAARGSRMLGGLLDYLRAALPAMRRSEAVLAQELELVRAYLTVMQLRMGPRLRYSIDIAPGAGTVPLPPQMITTLVENAIRHGLAPLPEGGTVAVRARIDDGQLIVAVQDDGAGFVAQSGSGVGLANTRARLAARYGDRAALRMTGNRPRGVIAEIRLPCTLAGAIP